MGTITDKSLILNEIKSYLGFEKDKELAEYLGIRPNTLSNWYQRNTFDYDLIYTKCDFLDGNWLLSGEGSMLRHDYLTMVNEQGVDYKKGKVIELSHESTTNTLMADIKASAGIGNIINNEKELMDLPGLSLPNAPLGLNIAFQISGDSMHPTIRHLDYVAGNKIHNVEDIRSGYVYIIVDRDDGVLCKRIYKEGDYLQIVSDNSSYPPYKRTYDDIVAYFKCFCRLSFDFKSYNDDLKTEVLDIKLRLNQLESAFRK